MTGDKKKEQVWRYIELLKFLEERDQYPSQLFEFFDRFPIAEIRQAILKKLESHSCSPIQYPDDCDWLERRIGAETLDYEVADKLLNAYLFKTPEDNLPLKVRALTFALNIFKRRITSTREITKMISGLITDQPQLYWLTPGLPEFTSILVGRLEPDLWQKDGQYQEYSDWDWTEFERAIRMIRRAEDIVVLPRLKAIQAKHKDKQLKPRDYNRGLYLEEVHQAIIAGAIKELSRFQKTQQSDLNRTFGVELKKAHGLQGNLDIQLWSSMNSSTDQNIEIGLSITYTRQEDLQKLLEALPKYDFRAGRNELTKMTMAPVGGKFILLSAPVQLWQGLNRFLIATGEYHQAIGYLYLTHQAIEKPAA